MTSKMQTGLYFRSNKKMVFLSASLKESVQTKDLGFWSVVISSITCCLLSLCQRTKTIRNLPDSLKKTLKLEGAGGEGEVRWLDGIMDLMGCAPE